MNSQWSLTDGKEHSSSVKHAATNATHADSVDIYSTIELRLCHLLAWPNYDAGYGFFVVFNYSYYNDRCYVKSVEPDSPAALGGLLPFDRILEINGKRVRDIKGSEGVVKEINKLKNRSLSKAITKSSESVKNSNSDMLLGDCLHLLVADAVTYEWLQTRRIDISIKNRALRVRECFTPTEWPPVPCLSSSSSTSLAANGTLELITINPMLIIVKRCTVRNHRGVKKPKLGFEMSKRGRRAHRIVRVFSSTLMSGLEPNDYLIELNGENIETEETLELEEKMCHLLEPGVCGHFCITTINKQGYDDCILNGILPSALIQADQVKKASENNDNVNLTQPCVVRQIVSDPRWIGDIINNTNQNQHCRYLFNVIGGTADERAGLKPGDLVLEINENNNDILTNSQVVRKFIEIALISDPVPLNMTLDDDDFTNGTKTQTESQQLSNTCVNTDDIVIKVDTS